MRAIITISLFCMLCLLILYNSDYKKIFGENGWSKTFESYHKDKLRILNNRYVNKQKILNTINFKNKSFFTLDLKEVSSQILTIKEIESVKLEKQINGEIHLSVQEKKPISLWIKNNKEFLIDENGGILEIEKNFFSNLLKVKGKSANVNASSILKTIDTFPTIKKKLHLLEFISQYRWNLYLDENIIVKLPYKDIEKALRFLSDLFINKRLDIQRFNIIDMRVNGRVFLR